MSGFAKIAQADDQARRRTADNAAVRRSINALTTHSELIGALIACPGSESATEELVASARQMIHATDDAARAILASLQTDMERTPWAHYQAMRVASRVVAARWKDSAARGAVTADISDQFAAWGEIMQHPVPEPVFTPFTHDDAAAIRLGLVEAMSPVINEVNVFSFFRKPEDCLRMACSSILDAATTASRQLAGDDADAESLRQLVYALIRNAGRIYAESWRKYAKDVVGDLQSRPREEINAYVKAHPEGLPVDTVTASFEQTFRRLVETVAHLVPPRRNPEATLEAASESTAESTPQPGAVVPAAEAQPEPSGDAAVQPGRESRESVEA